MGGASCLMAAARLRQPGAGRFYDSVCMSWEVVCVRCGGVGIGSAGSLLFGRQLEFKASDAPRTFRFGLHVKRTVRGEAPGM